MSSPRPDLRARIQAVLAEKGPIPAKHIERYFPGIDRGALDCALSALMRDNKISRELGAYDVVRPRKLLAKEAVGVTSRLPHERVAQMAPAPCSDPPKEKAALPELIRQLSPELQRSIPVGAPAAPTADGRGSADKAAKATAIKVTAPVVERPKPIQEDSVATVHPEPVIEFNDTSVETIADEPVVTGYFLERIKVRRQEAIDANFRAATELMDLQTKAADLREAIARREAYIARCDEFFAQSEMLAEGAA